MKDQNLEKIIKVKVIQNNLRYRLPGINKGASFSPKIGDLLSLKIDTARKEIKSKNVRKLFPEEIEELKPKKKKVPISGED